MPELKKEYSEKITVDKDGNVIESVIETIEVEVPTQQELIAEKEAKLLEMYAELEKLKNG